MHSLNPARHCLYNSFVNDEFELLDPRNAQHFLKQFASAARRKGQALVHQGMVHDLAATEPGKAYRAQVEDQQRYKVTLNYDGLKGWSGNCSCAQGLDC